MKISLCSSIDTETISRHALIEKDINLLGTRKEKIVDDAQNFQSDGADKPCDAEFLDERVAQLCVKYDDLMELAKVKRGTLDGQLLTHNLQNDLKEMDNWIHTKLDLLDQRNADMPANLIDVQKAISAHEVESSEVDGRRNKIAELQGMIRALICYFGCLVLLFFCLFSGRPLGINRNYTPAMCLIYL